MRITRTTACLAALLLVLPASMQAQQGDAGDDRAGIAAESGDVEAARERLHLLLLRPDVRRTARDRGIDLRPVHDGIETLGPAGLAQVAPYAEAVEAAEAQSAITIRTTTLIIILLLIILIVLVA